MPPVLTPILTANRSRSGLLVALCTVAALFVAIAAPSRAEAARVRCPGTFRVLHDDSIGRLKLPRGTYRITIFASGRPSCAQAAKLFTRFLDDFDGVLPSPWRVGVANSTFVRAPGVGFHVRRIAGTGGGEGGETGGEGGGSANANHCPGSFRVLHDDRVGRLRIPAGDYEIFLLQRSGLSCSQASRLFTRFLASRNGRLPAPWIVQPQTASFRRGARGVGFRIDPAG
jgi:hypothetical protein